MSRKDGVKVAIVDFLLSDLKACNAFTLLFRLVLYFVFLEFIVCECMNDHFKENKRN